MLVIAATVALLALAVSGCTDESSDRLTNKRARQLVEARWSEGLNFPYFRVPLGSIEVVRGVAREGQISVGEFPEVLQLQQMGVLTLSNYNDLSSQFTGWDDWLKLSGGVQRTVEISASRLGEEVGSIRSYYTQRPEDAWSELVIPLGALRVEEILVNESVPTTVGDHRLVLGRLADPNEKVKSVLEVIDKKPVDAFRAILRFDPFSGEWVVHSLETNVGDFRNLNDWVESQL